MPLSAWRTAAWRSWEESSDDNIGLIAAGVAFYGFLAIVPLLGAILLTYGIFVDQATVLKHVQALTAVMPREGALIVGGQLLELAQSPNSRKGLGVLFALGVALFGARNGAGAIITALNIAYEEKERRGLIALNLTALAFTAVAVIVAIVAAVAIAALAAVRKLLPFLDDALVFVGAGGTYLLLTLGGAAAAAALYRFGPSRAEPRWVWLTPGSVLSALAWLAITLGFGTYVAYIGRFDATYGSLGAVVALLTWLYLSSYALLFGAELNSEFERLIPEAPVGGPFGSTDAPSDKG